MELDATVDVVEPMGSEVFLSLSVGETALVARFDPVHLPVVGQQVRLAIHIDKAHFFDKETQQSLLS